MENVGYATLTIIPSARGFASALGGEVNGPMAQVGDSGGRASGGAFAGAFKGLVGPAMALFGAEALVGFVGSSIQAAGALQQSVGAIDTVFKGSSDQMHAWSSEAATSVGLTKNEFNELGTLIGTQLKNGGTAMEDLAPKTNELVTLGADLSSMFGGTTKEAVEALSSALKGETDPIEQFGVSLNAAAVEAKAAEMGFSKVGGELSAEAKQAATLAIIMDQTTDAHGNFTKELGTFSGQQQVLTAGWGNLKTSIGSLFLPVATSALQALNGLLPPIQALVDNLGGGGNAFAAFSAAFKAGDGEITSSGLPGFFERLGGIARTLADTFGPVWTAISGAVAPLIPQIASLVASFSPLSLVFQALGPVLPAIANVFSMLAITIGGALMSALIGLQPLVSTFVTAFSGILVAVMPAVTAMLTVLAGAIAGLIPVIMPLIGTVLQLATSLLSSLAPIITSLITAILPMAVSIFGSLVNAVGPLVSIIGAVLVPVIQALMPVVVTVFQVIANVVTSAMQVVQGIIQVVTGVITGNWSSVWQGLGNILSGAWGLIKSVVSGAISVVGSVIGAGLNLVQSIWNGAWSAVSGLLGGVWANISGAVSGGIGNVIGVISGLPGRAMGALGNLGGLLVGSGQALIQGFISGINNMIGNVTSAASNLVSKVRDFFPFSPAKRGPFAGRGYTTHSGRALVRDFAGAMEGQAGLVQKAADKVANAAHFSLVPEAPRFRTPTIEGGGVVGALAASSSAGKASIVQENHFNTPMSESAYAELAARRLMRAGVGK